MTGSDSEEYVAVVMGKQSLKNYHSVEDPCWNLKEADKVKKVTKSHGEKWFEPCGFCYDSGSE